MVIKAKNAPLQNGAQFLLGATGITIGTINLQGQAEIKGEIWKVAARKPIGINKKIRVLNVTGLMLEVEEVKN